MMTVTFFKFQKECWKNNSIKSFARSDFFTTFAPLFAISGKKFRVACLYCEVWLKQFIEISLYNGFN